MTYSYSKYSYKSSYYSHNSYQKSYEWTGFTEADLLGSGNGSSIGCGDTFTMPGAATVCMSTYDNDGYLSGDACYNENATDSTGQKATIDGGRVGSQMYAESYHVLKGSDGNTYYLIEIEVEGYDAPGVGDDFFTFYGKVPPAGVELSVVQTCNVKGNMIDYRCLGAGEKAPANTPPEFTNDPDYGKICIDENTTFVIDLNASDADGDTLTYEIVGGADAGKFQIDEATGELSFVDAPDFENPTDHGQDNVYEVKVKVSDGQGGEDTTYLKVCVDDVAEGGNNCIVIEAEDMCEWGFSKAWGCDASGGKLVKLDCAGGEGKLWTYFNGPEGNYDLKLFVQDENDGQSSIKIKVNGEVVKTIVLDADTDGSGSNNGSFSMITVDDLDLKAGDKISIWADGDCGEYVRIDKIELCLDDTPLPGSLSGTYFIDADKNGLDDDGQQVEGVTVELLDAAGNGTGVTTTTDANGNYSFGNLAAGTYGVKFTDTITGLVLTTQNVDGDVSDDIDSDAADIGGGMSQILGIEVLAGMDTPDNDAGVYDPNTAPVAADDSAMTCADEVKTVDVVGNDTDLDGDTLIIKSVDGQAIAEGETITTGVGTEVTLTGGQLVINGEAAHAGLDIGETAVEVISYSVSDGNGGTATANLEMTFCGDANSLESFCESLPATTNYQIRSSQSLPVGEYGFDMLVSGSGDSRLEGVVFEQAYCLSFLEPSLSAEEFVDAPVSAGSIICSVDAEAANAFNPDQVSVFNGLAAAENLDLINWILNENYESQGYTGWEVQRAIWELTDNTDLGYFDNYAEYGDDADVQFILEQAALNGEGFTPGLGDIVGLIVDPGDSNAMNTQPFIVALDLEQYDCLC